MLCEPPSTNNEYYRLIGLFVAGFSRRAVGAQTTAWGRGTGTSSAARCRTTWTTRRIGSPRSLLRIVTTTTCERPRATWCCDCSLLYPRSLRSRTSWDFCPSYLRTRATPQSGPQRMSCHPRSRPRIRRTSWPAPFTTPTPSPSTHSFTKVSKPTCMLSPKVVLFVGLDIWVLNGFI